MIPYLLFTVPRPYCGCT